MLGWLLSVLLSGFIVGGLARWGVGVWLGWLCREQRVFADAAAVARRLGSLVSRLERWEQGDATSGGCLAVARR